LAALRRGISALVALVVLALLAGCGGGGTGSTDFVAEGNKICEEDNAKFKALGAPEGSDVRPYLDKLVPVLDEDLSRLKGLNPPSDKASTYEAWISDLEQATAQVKEAQAAPSADAATKALQGSAPTNKQVDAEARQLGLDQCLSGAGTGSSSG
jgi:hypothetical protein